MRRTPSVTAKHYDESAQADANGSVSSDDADIDDSDEDKVFGFRNLCTIRQNCTSEANSLSPPIPF